MHVDTDTMYIFVTINHEFCVQLKEEITCTPLIFLNFKLKQAMLEQTKVS